MSRKTDAWVIPDLPTTDESVEDIEDEEDADGKRCLICFELESASRKRLWFIPCTHAACESCVQNLRRQAVCKDVKGVTCPYCRQSIEKYSNVKPARQAIKKTQVATQHLTTTRFHLVADKACPKGKPRVPSAYGWNGVCSIGGLNDYTPPPNVTGADGPGLKPNRSEEGLLDKFHGHDLKPTDNLLAMAESVSGSKLIHYNLTRTTGKIQKKLVRQLLEVIVPHARRLATHNCGNYTVQRMLGFASQHRGETVLGECGYTAFVRSLCKDKSLSDIACHDKGTFVVQKMVHCIGASSELRLVMDSIQGKVSLMANSPNACFSLERIVEVCIVSISQPADRAPYASPAEASKYLCSIANELCATKDLVFKASHAANYLTPMLLVECLRWSANEPRTRSILLLLARHAPEYVALGKWGKRFLQGLMSLDIPEVAQAIISCFVGEPEHPRAGHFSSLALNGPELFYSCLGTPCVTDEHRDMIVRDFMVGAAADTFFLKQPPVLQAFCVGLSLLPPNMLKEHVDILKALGSWGPMIQKMIQGFQADYCISTGDVAAPSQPQQQQRQQQPAPQQPQQPPQQPQQQQPLSTARRTAPAGSVQGAPNGHAQSLPPPSSNAENFPPLGAPRTSPPSAGGAVTASATNVSQSAEGERASTGGSEREEGQGERVLQASEGQAGQGSSGEGANTGAGAKQKKAKKKAAKEVAAAEAAPPAEGRSTASAAATEAAAGAATEAGAGAAREATAGAATEASRPKENRAGQAQGTDAAEGSQRAPGGAAGTGNSKKLASHSSGEVRPGSPGSGPMGEGSFVGKQVRTRIRAAPLACACCNSEPACMVIVDCRHLGSCSTCAPALSLCPICTGPVSELLQVSTCTVTTQSTTVTPAAVPQQTAGPHDQVPGAPQAHKVPSMPPGFGAKMAANAAQQTGNGVPHPASAVQPAGSSASQPALGVPLWQGSLAAATPSSSSSFDAPTYGEGSRLSRHSSQEMHAQLRSHGPANGMASTAALATQANGPSGGASVVGSGLVLPPGLATAAGVGGLAPMFPLEAPSGPGTFFHPARNSMPASSESSSARASAGYNGLGLDGNGQQQLQLQLEQQLQQQLQLRQQLQLPQQQLQQPQQQQQFPFSFEPFHPVPRATYPGAPGAAPLPGPQGGLPGAHPGYTLGAGPQLLNAPEASDATESYFERNFPFLAFHNDLSAAPNQPAMPESEPAKTVIRPAPYLPPGLMDW